MPLRPANAIADGIGNPTTHMVTCAAHVAVCPSRGKNCSTLAKICAVNPLANCYMTIRPFRTAPHMQPPNIMGLYTPLNGPLLGGPGLMNEKDLGQALGQPASGGFNFTILNGNFVVTDLQWWRSEMVRSQSMCMQCNCLRSQRACPGLAFPAGCACCILTSVRGGGVMASHACGMNRICKACWQLMPTPVTVMTY